ncbi:hypothetical protein OWV82_014019 [Melia azedarach]|uniref:Uncharacterized protein n=1 Tax=Melia azedarach TaxID=155640 RepID=A0ACC1XW85_MELAZ|nr:hypothetical protein OWV82_014019 [Melia azedarach]
MRFFVLSSVACGSPHLKALPPRSLSAILWWVLISCFENYGSKGGVGNHVTCDDKIGGRAGNRQLRRHEMKRILREKMTNGF